MLYIFASVDLVLTSRPSENKKMRNTQNNVSHWQRISLTLNV